MRVLVCGAGSSAHVLAAAISLKPGVAVSVLTQNAERARQWQQAMLTAPLTITDSHSDSSAPSLVAGVFSVTSDPAQAARGCDIVLLAVPAFLHRAALLAIRPSLTDGVVIVGLPGQSGFEFEVRHVFGSKFDRYVLMNFDSLPWVCRTSIFGRCAHITGTKETLVGAVYGDLSATRVRDPVGTLQWLIGPRPRLTVGGSLLGITMRSPNGYCHPPMMYGRWRDWNGEPLDYTPYFYRDVDRATANLLERVSAEVLETKQRLTTICPMADLSRVISVYDWDLGCYADEIADKTDLYSVTRTNAAYAELVHPMCSSGDGRFVPDFGHRFLVEDVPCGLAVMRGIAEIAGVATPCMDEVLLWCQEKMKKQYLVASRMAGENIFETRCPQRYGMKTPGDLVEMRHICYDTCR